MAPGHGRRPSAQLGRCPDDHVQTSDLGTAVSSADSLLLPISRRQRVTEGRTLSGNRVLWRKGAGAVWVVPHEDRTPTATAVVPSAVGGGPEDRELQPRTPQRAPGTPRKTAESEDASLPGGHTAVSGPGG